LTYFRTTLSPAELGGIVAGAILLGLCFLGGLAYILTRRRRLQRPASHENNNSAGFNSTSVAQVFSDHTRNARNAGPGPSSSLVPFVLQIPPRQSGSGKRSQVGVVFTSNKSVSANLLLRRGRVENLTPQTTIPY
jgi:hypothetical protein